MHKLETRKLSEYGLKLREKQKVKRYYGVYDTQFRNYYKRALAETGQYGENLIILLERRLDNVICRGGFAYSHTQARQFINHGHIPGQWKETRSPSYLRERR